MHRLSAVHQLHLHSQLNTWLQWIGPRQLRDETRNINVLGYGASYIREWRYIIPSECSCKRIAPSKQNICVQSGGFTWPATIFDCEQLIRLKSYKVENSTPQIGFEPTTTRLHSECSNGRATGMWHFPIQYIPIIYTYTYIYICIHKRAWAYKC